MEKLVEHVYGVLDVRMGVNVRSTGVFAAIKGFSCFAACVH